MYRDRFGLMDRIALRMGKLFSEKICLSDGLGQNVNLKLFGSDGKLKDERNVHNQVQLDGKYDALAQLLVTPGKALLNWMEVGHGSGQPTTTGTVLAAYISGSRTVLDSKNRSNAVLTMVCTFAATVGTGAITEAGVFNIVTQNTADMWLYSSFDVINKGDADSLVITWTLTYA